MLMGIFHLRKKRKRVKPTVDLAAFSPAQEFPLKSLQYKYSNTRSITMKKVTAFVQSSMGLHARPATDFVKCAKSFSSSITVTHDGKTVNGKSILNILSLGVPHGGEVLICADGSDEERAAALLASILSENGE